VKIVLETMREDQSEGAEFGGPPGEDGEDFMNQRIEVVLEDITKLDVDAIVNAANNSLLGGGGVDGAIHRAAGPELLAACRPLNGCDTGDAKVTEGFDLPARYVIHTAGPKWSGGEQGERDLLASCYRRSLEEARDHGYETIAFPAISCGIYGFPPELAAPIAIDEIRRFLSVNHLPNQVLLVAFDEKMATILSGALESGAPTEPPY
jgi:O-acetyl-ADP-ribose deacetylase (regulator of RNase III)